MIRCKISQESVGGLGSPRVPSFLDLKMDIIFQNPREGYQGRAWQHMRRMRRIELEISR